MRARIWFLIVGVIFVALFVWFSGPVITALISERIHNSIGACSDGDIQKCNEQFARLGQTGDLYGPIASLFSGVAMLLVVITIAVDAYQRRASRKPLVVCQISEEERIAFDEPASSSPAALRLKVNLCISALNDVALNAAIEARIMGDSWERSFETHLIPVPMTDGGTPQSPSIALRLNEADLVCLVKAYDKERKLMLSLRAVCDSMEGMKWETSVKYRLQFRETDFTRINSLISDLDNVEKNWPPQAIVQPEYKVEQGSWKHFKL